MRDYVSNEIRLKKRAKYVPKSDVFRTFKSKIFLSFFRKMQLDRVRESKEKTQQCWA